MSSDSSSANGNTASSSRADTAAGQATAAGGAQGWLQSLRTRFGLPGGQTLRDTLESALSMPDQGASAFTAEERQMLLRLLRFGALRVDDVMVPRADIISADESETLGELLQLFEEAGVSRVPLYNETLDDPRGMIHIKDLLSWMLAEAAGRSIDAVRPAGTARPTAAAGKAVAADRPMTPDKTAALEKATADRPGSDKGAISDKPRADPAEVFALGNVDLKRPIPVAKLRRPVLYVPASMPAMNLLIRMQTTRVHMALVVDEYGGTDGLVTIEDLVEQIVGDIEDEHDETEAAHLHEDPKLGLIASARTPMNEFERHIGQQLLTAEDQQSIDTLGGLVFSLVGRVPARGELVRHPSGLEFEVLDADARRIKKLRVHRPNAPALPRVAGGPQA